MVMAIHSGPMIQPPSEAGMIMVKSGLTELMNTRVYRALSQARTEVMEG